MKQIFFYFKGSNKGIQVNSRNDLLAVLKNEADNIVAIDIELINGEFCVLALMKGDPSWISVGKTDNMI